MKKILLLVFYGVGAFLFVGFFPIFLRYILLILFSAGLAVFLFSARWSVWDRSLKDLFWLVASFLWLANIFSFFAAGLNFSLGVFLVFIIVFFALFLGLSGRGGRGVFICGFCGALVISEFFWAVAFLPFGYLTLSGLVFVVFYLVWTVFLNHLKGSLGKEIIFKNLAFSAAMMVILLLSTRWQP